jgi:hypothetical protein
VTEEEEVEIEEDEDGHTEFILFMGIMMFLVSLFWIFSPFVSLNFIRFLRFCFLFGFLFFGLL